MKYLTHHLGSLRSDLLHAGGPASSMDFDGRQIVASRGWFDAAEYERQTTAR